MAATAKASASGHGRISRYRQIADILARHGLGFLGVRGGATLPGSAGSRRISRPEHLRLAIEELGPTFIKLGQILSTRGDLLPAEYLAELVKLQDSAPPVPAEEVRRILQEELGRPVSDVFATFDLQP